MDLGGTKIEAVVLDGQGASLWRERVATPAGNYRAILSAVAALVNRAEGELGLSGRSVGVGTPGSLTRTGHFKNSNSAACRNSTVCSRVCRVYGVRTCSAEG